MSQFALFLGMATIIEGLTEYIFADLPGFPKPYLKYVALLVGVVVCVAYRLDILILLFEIEPPIPVVGQVFSGLLLGRGSNYLNDFIRQWVKRGG